MARRGDGIYLRGMTWCLGVDVHRACQTEFTVNEGGDDHELALRGQRLCCAVSGLSRTGWISRPTEGGVGDALWCAALWVFDMVQSYGVVFTLKVNTERSGCVDRAGHV
jgi:hypothetical protein